MSAPGFYVSVIDGTRSALVAGPFDTHAEALARVQPERDRWYDIDPKSHWYAWGTARVRDDKIPAQLGGAIPEQEEANS